jgi:hypothetical protein
VNRQFAQAQGCETIRPSIAKSDSAASFSTRIIEASGKLPPPTERPSSHSYRNAPSSVNCSHHSRSPQRHARVGFGICSVRPDAPLRERYLYRTAIIPPWLAPEPQPPSLAPWPYIRLMPTSAQNGQPLSASVDSQPCLYLECQFDLLPGGDLANDMQSSAPLEEVLASTTNDQNEIPMYII